MKRPFKGTYTVTQEWGKNPEDYAKFGLKGHNGVDYGTPFGTPILAPHSGTVIETEYDPYGYGTYVKIENDVEGSILAHLSKHEVNPGDVITEGTQIGLSGNTGNSTGPHLHWGYYRKPRNKSDGYSGTTNPWKYLDENNPNPPADTCENIKKELETLKIEHEKCSMLNQEVSTLKIQLLNTQTDLAKATESLSLYQKQAEDLRTRMNEIHVKSA